MSLDTFNITVALVSQLIAEQFPQWADLPIRPVAVSGWDNRTFHLGDNMSVRLPSGQEYAAQVLKEQTWLPILSEHVSIPISQMIAMGQPSPNYPFHWSIYRWIDGQSANTLQPDELEWAKFSKKSCCKRCCKCRIMDCNANSCIFVVNYGPC